MSDTSEGKEYKGPFHRLMGYPLFKADRERHEQQIAKLENDIKNVQKGMTEQLRLSTNVTAQRLDTEQRLDLLTDIMKRDNQQLSTQFKKKEEIEKDLQAQREYWYTPDPINLITFPIPYFKEVNALVRGVHYGKSKFEEKKVHDEIDNLRSDRMAVKIVSAVERRKLETLTQQEETNLKIERQMEAHQKTLEMRLKDLKD